MHLQILSSGSGGNCALLRCDERRLLIDAGLPGEALRSRLAQAGVPPPTSLPSLHGVFVTHGHLDHARSAGIIARKYRTRVYCSESVMRTRSIARCENLETLRIGGTHELDDGVVVSNVPIPHDAHPTVSFRIDHGGRRAVILTDIGRPDASVARALAGAHVLVLEFNHDRELLARGPYPPPLKQRVAGDQGHLSNEQAAEMLKRLASENLHTLVLAHLSEKNNRPEFALEAAQRALDELGLASRVRVLVASQHEVGENVAV